jgi:hypothetical protein
VITGSKIKGKFRIMPVPAITAEEMKTAMERMEPKLVFILDKNGLNGETQAHLAKNGLYKLSRFATIADDVNDFKAMLKTDLNLDSAEGLDMRLVIADIVAAYKMAGIQWNEESERTARARASETPMAVPIAEHRKIRKAFENIHGELPAEEIPGRYFLGLKIDQAVENNPIAEKLTQVCHRTDDESEVFTPCFGEDGRIVTKKGAPQNRAKPRNSEELRNRHRLIGAAWTMVQMQHANRPWLAGVTPRTWERFTDFLVGSQVATFQVRQENGQLSQAPSWFIVLHYEHELRRKAYELITEGQTMVLALKAAMDCDKTRQLHFTMPLHLEIARTQGRPAASSWEERPKPQNWGAKAIQDVFDNGKGSGKKDQKGKKEKGKGGGKKGLKSKAPGPKGNKRKICYSFNNNQGCDGSCGMVHICQICSGDDHGKSACPTLKNGPPVQKALA